MQWTAYPCKRRYCGRLVLDHPSDNPLLAVTLHGVMCRSSRLRDIPDDQRLSEHLFWQSWSLRLPDGTDMLCQFTELQRPLQTLCRRLWYAYM